METNHIYQYSVVNALMAGVADGGITVEEYIKKGNVGLGTFQKIQGELVSLDGKVYQLQANGHIREANPSEQLPYAVATNFVADKSIKTKLINKDSIDKLLEKYNDHAGNLFMSYRIEGRFQSLKCRTVRGQEYEGQSLAELGDKQEVQNYENIEGTIVGFRTPIAWQGFFVAGEHMHFIDKDRKVGGHVLELSAERVNMGIATVNNVHIELPTSNKFNAAKLTTDDAGLKDIEG